VEAETVDVCEPAKNFLFKSYVLWIGPKYYLELGIYFLVIEFI